MVVWWPSLLWLRNKPQLKFRKKYFLPLCIKKCKTVSVFFYFSCTENKIKREKKRKRKKRSNRIEGSFLTWQHNGHGGPRQRSMADKTVLKCGVFISTVHPEFVALKKKTTEKKENKKNWAATNLGTHAHIFHYFTFYTKNKEPDFENGEIGLDPKFQLDPILSSFLFWSNLKLQLGFWSV